MGVAAAVVAADQVTKTVALHDLRAPHHVLGPLWLELSFNTGASFGLGRGATPVVETVAVLLVALLAVLGRRASRSADRWTMVGIGLLAGGALGNLTDRFLRHHHGAVIDFIDAAQVGRRQLWPVFNLADSAIVAGAAVLVVAYGLGTRRARQAVPAARPEPGDGDG